ncbi:MAG: RHS repeat-associated core domain-containing protein [Candidatus Woesearchaeota archaeon]
MKKVAVITLVVTMTVLFLVSGCQLRGEASAPFSAQSAANEPLARAATPTEEHYVYGVALEAKYSEDGLRYMHQDVLGSSRAITDTAGVLVEENTFLPYGETLGASSERFSFTGKEDDGELQYSGARYYDSDTGRFTQKDPIEDNNNWYAYVSNNPLKYVDPTGLGDTNWDYGQISQDFAEFTSTNIDSVCFGETDCSDVLIHLIGAFAEQEGYDAVLTSNKVTYRLSDFETPDDFVQVAKAMFGSPNIPDFTRLVSYDMEDAQVGDILFHQPTYAAGGISTYGHTTFVTGIYSDAEILDQIDFLFGPHKEFAIHANEETQELEFVFEQYHYSGWQADQYASLMTDFFEGKKNGEAPAYMRFKIQASTYPPRAGAGAPYERDILTRREYIQDGKLTDVLRINPGIFVPMED